MHRRETEVGVLATFLAADQENLVAPLPHIPELGQDIWLSMRSSARIRAVVDFMGQVCAGYRQGGD
ncbi:hypothetical protein [Massilia sp. HP4]|uniref:hypothetical protein n=1 Tax=Massilia sp. HP4 TaxID=2562316 RepID=UPI0010C12753|nr:hypothetical protein [Massilia sp. HP4]